MARSEAKEKSMNIRQIAPLSLLLSIALCSAALAQVVDIPDSNLQAAIRHELQLLPTNPITKEDMLRLESLDAAQRDITTLTGLEHAMNLQGLILWGNPLSDLTPIASLTALAYLDIAACAVSDITAVSNLTQLYTLNLRFNRIVDITPLAKLTNLVHLHLNGNNITDVTPLTNLTRLEFLEIHNNLIENHTPLDILALSHFIYDQACEMPPLPIESRVENRNYPSIFARWSGFGWPPSNNRPDLSDAENLALHDLRLGVDPFGLRIVERTHDAIISGHIEEATRLRDEVLQHNPNALTLFTLQLTSAPLGTFPVDSPYWIRDEHGDIFIAVGIEDGEPSPNGYLDLTHPAVQDRVVQHAVAVSKCGLYDGIMFDYWHDIYNTQGAWDGTRWYYPLSLEEEVRAKEIMLQRIRANTYPDFLIMGNVNDNIIPRTGPYVNGGFMETATPGTLSPDNIEVSLTRIENTLLWLEQNLREPRINGLEGFTIPTKPLDSPTNLRWMRAFTALSLTHSDGYILFETDGDHGHYWYDFWDANLGRPVGPKSHLYDEDTPGLYIREFTNGWAVYNHSGEAQEITLPKLVTGVASRVEGTKHALPDLDGEMYLRVKPKNPADVNGDGLVNILDLTLVAQGFGTDKPEADVNGDGVVNVFDLVFVAHQF